MKNGFSLVELSIVLVILGLLTGGILAGQSLIRASELRAVTTEFQRYVTATHSFRDKYFALPGDMANAQSFWGVAHATPATCVTTSSVGSATTCNGDGNGRVDVSAGANERFRFWQHLANAGLLEGAYSGIQQGGTAYGSTTANVPRSKVGNGLWYSAYAGTFGSDPVIMDGVYNNHFELGSATANADPTTALFKPEELWNIDTKLDDGKPATGKLVARIWATCTNGSGSSDKTASYALSTTSIACVAMFPQAY